jgi:DNA-binding MarR family transcriptional regulator
VNGAQDSDLGARLQAVLGRLARQLRRESPSEVGPGALSAMSTLSREGPMRPSDLAAREGVRPPTMTRILAVLEDSGHVVRTVDPADRRASLVTLTPVGRSALVQTRRARVGQLARHLAELSGDQRRTLAEALPALEALAGIEPATQAAAPGADQ